MEIKDKHFDYADGVTRKLNEWASKGYNLKDYFIQIVCYGTPAIHNYTIFYDSKLDE